jgi:hypothetical protein
MEAPELPSSWVGHVLDTTQPPAIQGPHPCLVETITQRRLDVGHVAYPVHGQPRREAAVAPKSKYYDLAG